MIRNSLLVVAVLSGMAACCYVGFINGAATRVATKACDCSKCRDCDCTAFECQTERRVPIAKPRPPRRFDDGRVAPFEATTEQLPYGAAPPPPLP